MDWAAIGEQQRRVQTALLDDDAVAALRVLPYVTGCALTDVRLRLRVRAGWSPSYVVLLDAARSRNRETRIVSVRNARGDCRFNTTLTLSADGQRLRCDGGPSNGCGMRNVPPPPSPRPSSADSVRATQLCRRRRRDPARPTPSQRPSSADSVTAVDTWFIKYVSMDPHGPDHWYCSGHEESNDYTFTGSYYYAYVKLASCPLPTESRMLGDAVTLRPNRDSLRSAIIIVDPTKSALSDGVVQAWHIYAKIVSIEHRVYLQVWRPASAEWSYEYSLVGQTFVAPTELRFHEIVLRASEFIRVRRGDVLGLYFTAFNPVAWSAVPCGDARQRHAVLVDAPPPTNVTVGARFRFTPAAAARRDACRYYSFAALFANRTRSKLIEDHACPLYDDQPPFDDVRDASGGGDIDGAGPSATRVDRRLYATQPGDGSDAAADEEGSSSWLSSQRRYGRRPPGDGLGPTSTFFALLVVACILLLMIVVGSLSYYVAVRHAD